MKKLKQRLSSLLLCAALLVSLCAPAAAEEAETYLTWNGSELVPEEVPTSITEVTNDTTELNGTTTDGWYIVRGSVKISGRVTVSGDVHLILADDCALTVTGGIEVDKGNSLTIYAQSTDVDTMGKLTATSGAGGDAGIGGVAGIDAGTITINGGNVTAEGSDGGAGIGGGIGGGGGTGGGSTVTISGGEVTATGSSCGISGGSGDVSITGGTVRASSSGSMGNGIGSNGSINVTAGNVTANGYYGINANSAVTISGGEVETNGSDYGIYSDGSINVTAGKVTVNGSEYGIYSFGAVTISGGTVTATGTSSYSSLYGIRSGNNMTISGGTVTANGYDFGIYGGSITISGGEVEASGSRTGIYSKGSINVTAGKVTAMGTGNSGYGIGIQGLDNMTISGGTVTASGTGNYYGYGIQGGNNTISGGTVTATGTSDSGNGIGIQGRNTTTISGGTVTATGTSSSSYVYGIDGPFSTGTDGSAFIAASSIEDNSAEKKKQWSGVIFEGTDNGKVYGSEITLGTDATIPAGKALEIEEGQTLIVGEGVTLTNNGTITGTGTIINNGTIKGNLIDSSVVTHSGKTEWSSDSSGHWHPCAVADCTEHKFAAATHTPGAAATCTEPQVCTVCGQETAPALGHSLGEKVPQKDATTASTGMKAHYLCSRCGNYFDENKNPTTAEALTIPKKASGSSGGGGGSYTPPTYPPTVERPSEGGGVSVSPANPRQGDTVTVTPKADEGYEVEKVTVTDRGGKSVEVTKKPDGTYTFTQPAGSVTIEIEYAPVPLTELPWENPFGDVSESDWYYEAVRFVLENGLMTGYEDGRFGPNDNLSRAQLAQILFNKEGRPGVNYLPDFSDVAGGAWYTEAVRWAASQGIAGGYGNGTFGPDAPITREQLAVMLWRYAGSPETGRDAEFADMAQVSDYALEAVDWARANGIVQGRDGNRFDPQGQATRAEAAQREPRKVCVKENKRHPFSQESEQETNLIERMYYNGTDAKGNAESIRGQPEVQQHHRDYGHDERDVPGRIAAGDGKRAGYGAGVRKKSAHVGNDCRK